MSGASTRYKNGIMCQVFCGRCNIPPFVIAQETVSFVATLGDASILFLYTTTSHPGCTAHLFLSLWNRKWRPGCSLYHSVAAAVIPPPQHIS